MTKYACSDKCPCEKGVINVDEKLLDHTPVYSTEGIYSFDRCYRFLRMENLADLIDESTFDAIEAL